MAKHDSFRKILDSANEGIAAIEVTTATLRAEREKLAAEIGPLEGRIRELSKQIKELENPKNKPSLGDLKNDKAAAHRALGARGITAEMGEVGAEGTDV